MAQASIDQARANGELKQTFHAKPIPRFGFNRVTSESQPQVNSASQVEANSQLEKKSQVEVKKSVDGVEKEKQAEVKTQKKMIRRSLSSTSRRLTRLSRQVRLNRTLKPTPATNYGATTIAIKMKISSRTKPVL